MGGSSDSSTSRREIFHSIEKIQFDLNFFHSPEEPKTFIQIEFFKSDEISLFLKSLTQNRLLAKLNYRWFNNFNFSQLYFKYKQTSILYHHLPLLVHLTAHCCCT